MDLKSILKSIKINEPLISTILGALVVAAIALMLVNYFKNKVNTLSTSTPSAQTENAKQNTSLPATYKVEKGDSLWSISGKHYNSGYNWVDIASANNLANPNLIEEGQELTIPKVEEKTAVKPQITPKAAQVEAISSNSYKVVKGDNLWEISVRAYADGYQWTKILEVNKDKIKNPNLIYPDQEFAIPR